GGTVVTVAVPLAIVQRARCGRAEAAPGCADAGARVCVNVAPGRTGASAGRCRRSARCYVDFCINRVRLRAAGERWVRAFARGGRVRWRTRRGLAMRACPCHSVRVDAEAMRLGEIARLAGVSARSIRHYHRLGVLAEPPRTGGGYRDYAVADLARIARIAFLSGSGVPLREIGALLEGSDADPAADLAALRDGIDQRIADLTRQRERLDVIARRAAEGLPPGLLPESVTRALDFCRADAAGDAELSALLDR